MFVTVARAFCFRFQSQLRSRHEIARHHSGFSSRVGSSDMNQVLEHGFYYKTDPPSAWLLRTYPPDRHQTTICQKLNLPPCSWSFYRFKKEHIRDAFSSSLCYRNNTEFELWLVDKLLPEAAPGTSYLPFSKMALSDDELFFVLFHDEIESLRKHGFCVRFPVLKLQTLCANRLVEEMEERPETLTRLSALPRALLSQLERESLLPPLGPPPRYDRRRMRARFLEACRPLDDLFSEIDARVFCPEFVVWFQNDPFVRRSFRRTDGFRVVFFAFRMLRDLFWEYNVCLKCMKWHMCRSKKKTAWERCFYFRATQELAGLLEELQSPTNWCAECRRTPLFHIVSPEEFEKHYGQDEYEYFMEKEEVDTFDGRIIKVEEFY